MGARRSCSRRRAVRCRWARTCRCSAIRHRHSQHPFAAARHFIKSTALAHSRIARLRCVASAGAARGRARLATAALTPLEHAVTAAPLKERARGQHSFCRCDGSRCSRSWHCAVRRRWACTCRCSATRRERWHHRGERIVAGAATLCRCSGSALRPARASSLRARSRRPLPPAFKIVQLARRRHRRCRRCGWSLIKPPRRRSSWPYATQHAHKQATRQRSDRMAHPGVAARTRRA